MAVADTTQLRETIRQSFRKACLKRLEGHEAEAVKILQEELPSKIKEWKLSDDCRPGEMEALLGEELARTESAHWVVKETEARLKKSMDGVLSASQAEAMQSLVSAKLQMELTGFKNKLDSAVSEMLTVQGAEAIGSRISQELSERIRTMVTQAFESQKGHLEDLPSKEDLDQQIDQIRSGLGTHLQGIAQKVVTTEIVEELLRENFAPLNLQIDSVKVISENSASALAGEIAGYEKREMSRWADRQGIWARMFEGLLKKNELEAALWQVQNAIGERIEGKVKNWEGFAGEVKTLLSEGLQKLVSAEAFEARLMTSVNMLHEAQTKALQENSASIKVALDKRLTETSGPIFQRVSSLITYADWERVTRDVNEKLANQLTAEIGNKVEEQSEMQLRNMRALVEHQNQSGTHTALLENLRAFSERLAALTLETAEQQKTLLKSVQKEIAEQQTQSLGLLSMQQQNFLGNLQRDWDGLKKSLEEIKVRQIALEADLRGVTSAVENRLRDQTQLVQSELNAMHHRLENGLTEVFSKKMKNIRVVTD